MRHSFAAMPTGWSLQISQLSSGIGAFTSPSRVVEAVAAMALGALGAPFRSGRKLKPLVLGHHLGLLRIALVGWRHDLHTVLVEHVQDAAVQGRIQPGTGLRLVL